MALVDKEIMSSETLARSETTATVLLLSAVEGISDAVAEWMKAAEYRGLTRVYPELREGNLDLTALSLEETPDCVVLWGDALGAELALAVRLLRLELPHAGLVVIGGEVELMSPREREAVQAGADAVLDPGVTRDKLLFTVRRLMDLMRLRSELRYLRRRDADGAALGKLVGDSGSMRAVFGKIMTLCRRSSRVRTPPPVLLTGETGTGKGQMARAIHYNGLRRDQALVEVNCAALPPNLVEGELFGTERGAYTGAVTSRPGLLEVAHRGSVFLDEVGTLESDIQAKLLRFLDDQRLRRLGSTRERVVDVQLIAATNRDLGAAVQAGSFREDLFFRLSVVHIHLPPLRERGDDVVSLAELILEDRCRAYGIAPMQLSNRARDALRRYSWPGNIRELRNRLERVVLLHDGPDVGPEHLDLPLDELRIPTGQGEVHVSFPPDGIQLEEVVDALVAHALERAEGNLSQAARLLGITRAALRYRLGR